MKTSTNADRVRELLDYSPETGAFRWKVKTGSRSGGQGAGTRHKHKKCVYIQIDGHIYKAHRLAILWATGDWPETEIDHRNGDGFDNRLDNLRPATRKSNMQNKRKAHKNSKTGLLGASPQGDRFRARIRVDGKMRCLGMFSTAEDAHAAYVAAKRKFHEGNTL